MSTNQTIETVSDMMAALQDEIEQVKAGTLPLDTARIVAKFRQQQLLTAQLQIMYMRAERHNKNQTRSDRSLVTGKVVTRETPQPAIAAQPQIAPPSQAQPEAKVESS